MPCRRAVEEDPLRLSATIRTFSFSVQRRRRPVSTLATPPKESGPLRRFTHLRPPSVLRMASVDPFEKVTELSGGVIVTTPPFVAGQTKRPFSPRLA